MTDTPKRHRVFSVLPSWVSELRDPATVRADAVAGVAVALVLIPQAMAYAQLAGLPPIHGLYAGLLPMVVAALFGSSRLLVSGPAAVICIMMAAALEPLGLDPQTYIGYALLLAAMVGVFQVLLGVLRLGVLVDFISHPVVIGFTDAAALIIATSQLPKLFRIDIGDASRFAARIASILVQLPRTHFATLAMSALTFAVLIAVKRWKPRFPAVLAAVAAATLASRFTGFARTGGAIVGDIPVGLPSLRLPPLDADAIPRLVGPAITIALVGIMSAISIAKVIALRTRQPLNANRELIGQGLGNLTACVSQGCVVAGSFARSAVNWNAGARTPFSSVVTAVVVAATLLFFTPLLYHLPQAALGVVTINAVTSLIQVKPILRAWRAQKHCGIVAGATFLATLLMAPRMELGMLAGVALSVGFYLSRTMRPRFAELGIHPDGTMRDARVHGLLTCPFVAICRFDGSLFFANVSYFESLLLQILASKPRLRRLVIDAKGINHIDASGLDVLVSISEQLKAQGVDCRITHVKKQLNDVFLRSGFAVESGGDLLLASSEDALRQATAEYSSQCAGPCPLLADSEIPHTSSAYRVCPLAPLDETS